MKPTIGVILLIFGIYFIGLNYVRQITNYRNRKQGIDKHSSPAPFIGPLAFFFGWLFFFNSMNRGVFLVFLLDPDTVMVAIGLPYAIWKGHFRQGESES